MMDTTSSLQDQLKEQHGMLAGEKETRALLSSSLQFTRDISSDVISIAATTSQLRRDLQIMDLQRTAEEQFYATAKSKLANSYGQQFLDKIASARKTCASTPLVQTQAGVTMEAAATEPQAKQQALPVLISHDDDACARNEALPAMTALESATTTAASAQPPTELLVEQPGQQAGSEGNEAAAVAVRAGEVASAPAAEATRKPDEKVSAPASAKAAPAAKAKPPAAAEQVAAAAAAPGASGAQQAGPEGNEAAAVAVRAGEVASAPAATAKEEAASATPAAPAGAKPAAETKTKAADRAEQLAPVPVATVRLYYREHCLNSRLLREGLEATKVPPDDIQAIDVDKGDGEQILSEAVAELGGAAGDAVTLPVVVVGGVVRCCPSAEEVQRLWSRAGAQVPADAGIDQRGASTAAGSPFFARTLPSDASWEATLRTLRDKRESFQDAEFPPNDDSLGIARLGLGVGAVKWKRAADIYHLEKPEYFTVHNNKLYALGADEFDHPSRPATQGAEGAVRQHIQAFVRKECHGRPVARVDVKQLRDRAYVKVTFSKPEIAIFQRGEDGTFIDPGDVDQGWLGDCYFISAMSSLGLHDERILEVFPDHTSASLIDAKRDEPAREQQYNAEGLYAVRFWHEGCFRHVVVDDYFPVH
eukprot:g8127.t1